MDDTEAEAGPKAKRAGKVKPVIAKPKQPVVKTRPAKTGVVLRKKDFVDRATERAGISKSQTRTAIDAALSVLADALMAGDEVVLPPLGKLRLMQQKDNGKAKVATLRLQFIDEGEGGRPKPSAAED